MKNTQKRFPEIATHLNSAIKSFAISHRSLRQARVAIANKLGVSVQAVDSWRRGVRRIPEEKIELLAQVLGHQRGRHLTPEGIKLVDALRLARDKDSPLVSWKERIESGAKLTVAEASYPGAGKFWGRIFFSFLGAANVKPGKPEIDLTTCHFDQLHHAVWSGDLDVALGTLSTPRLSLKLWFFNSPIHYRLNCILPSRPDTTADLTRLRHALGCKKARQRLFIPIIMKEEVGEAYALNNLDLDPEKEPNNVGKPIYVESLSPDEFCSKLAINQDRADGRIPLIIVDEITCLSILTKLKGGGQLVFPLVPDFTAPRALIPPSFPLGICVSRNEGLGHAKRRSELVGFLRDALTNYIGGNAQGIAFFYIGLRNQIRRLLDRALPEIAVNERAEWLARTFRLDQEWLDLEPHHWRAVLREAMRLLSMKGE